MPKRRFQKVPLNDYHPSDDDEATESDAEEMDPNLESFSSEDEGNFVNEGGNRNSNSSSIKNLSRADVRLKLIDEVNWDVSNTGRRIKKTPIRQMLLYFQDELVGAANSVGIELQSGHITRFKATNFENMKLGETGQNQYWGYIDNSIRFFNGITRSDY
jgi:hypothetical protein